MSQRKTSCPWNFEMKLLGEKNLENVIEIGIILALPLSTVMLIVAKWTKWRKAQKHLRSDHPRATEQEEQLLK